MLSPLLTAIMSATVKKIPIPKNGVDYRGKVVLAPMVRSGECPSRLMALKYGADLVWGPETIDKALIGTTRRENAATKTVDFTRPASNGGGKHPTLQGQPRENLIYRLCPEREGRRLIYQIGTSDPDTAVRAAQLIARDVAGIDVNAGCPKPFSTLGGMGAALLKKPDTLCAILTALVRDVGVPHQIGISVKIRILDTAEQTSSLVRRLCATGITGLTVHCRTTPMRPRQPAVREQLRAVAAACREAGVACLMNGDVASRDEAQRLVAEYGVDGAMIATAAENNPSVFRPASLGGRAPWEKVVREYVETALEVENHLGNTKYLLGQMIPGKSALYNTMAATKSYADLVRGLGYADLMRAADDVDRRLELGAYEKPKLTKAERKAANKAAAKSAEKTRGVGVKRSAETAELDLPLEQAREQGLARVPDNASALAV